MKRLLLLFISLAVTIVEAKDKEIPLEVFAKHPQFKQMKISPTGQYLAFTYEDGAEVNLAILDRQNKKITGSFSWGDSRQVVRFNWLNDERVEMLIQKITGWLDGTRPNTRWVAANIDGEKITDLWDFQRSNLSYVDNLDDDPEHILVTKGHFTDEGAVKLFKLNTYTGKLSYITGVLPRSENENPGIIGVLTDLNGEVKFATEMDRGEDEISDEDDVFYLHYRRSSGTWSKVQLDSARKKPNFRPLGISLDNSTVYFASNHDIPKENKDTLGLFSFNLNTQKVKFLFRHDDVDMADPIIGRQGQMVGATYEPGYPQKYFINNDANKEDITHIKSLLAAFKGQNVSISEPTQDLSTAVAYVRSDKNPGDFYIYNFKSRKLKYQASTKPEVNPKLMARVEPFKFKSRDDLLIYGQLTIPNVKKEENLPLVLYPHGGPYGVTDRWGWDRRAQMLASRGYLVMQVNFRGSGGYGDKFHREGFGEWGKKMQNDLTDATYWAINSGLADQDRVCIHGVSYGGYASMNAVVMEPDLYKCSIPDAGPYELQLQWDKADSFQGNPEYKEYYLNRMVGSEDNIKDRSPVYHIDKLKAALFIVHGTEDVRVPIENAYLLEEHLNKKGIQYKKMYKEDGHGFQKEEYRVELYEEMLKFLKEHIGK